MPIGKILNNVKDSVESLSTHNLKSKTEELMQKRNWAPEACELAQMFLNSDRESREDVFSRVNNDCTPKDCLWILMSDFDFNKSEFKIVWDRLSEKPHLVAMAMKSDKVTFTDEQLGWIEEWR